MKRFFTILLFVLVAVAGFTVGRMTGQESFLDVNTAKRVFPMLPVPPKESDLTAVNAATQPAEQEKEIVLEVPIEGAALSGTFEVSGRTRAADKEVSVVVKDKAGETLFRTKIPVEAQEAGQFGRFSQSVSLPQHELGPGTVEVFFENPGGSPPTGLITRQVTFVEPDTVAVKVYFRMAGFNGPDSCDAVQPVERTISSKVAVYRAVIDELIKGPSEPEKAAGYSSALPLNVTLKSVASDADGIVKADFTTSLTRGVYEHCRQEAVRAQITSTLKQFLEVRDVVISVNGRTAGVLQP